MSAPWMPLYISDYLADTSHLSTLEHGAYLLLIMHYWRNAGLPDDEKKLARICRLTTRQWDAIRDTIAEFFGEGWVHHRIDKEISRAADKSERRAASGSRGGIAKSLKNKETKVANATNLPEQNDSNALPSSSQPQPDTSSLRSDVGIALTSNFVGSGKPNDNVVGLFDEIEASGLKTGKRKPANQKPAYSPLFGLVWETFPKHPNASKQQAFSEFQRLSEDDQNMALDGAMAFQEILAETRARNPRYDPPHLSTWLHQRRFDDALEAKPQFRMYRQ